MWLWSQNPASSAMELNGSHVSRNRRVALSTRNRAAVSCSPSPVACRYADPTHEGCRRASAARSLIFKAVSSLSRRVIVLIQPAGSGSGWRPAPSRNRRSAARRRSSQASVWQVSEVSRLSADATSDPKIDWQRCKQSASEPGRVELDLDLFESYRRGCVAMPRTGTIENRGWAGNELLPNLGLVQIGADHKERKNGPVMGVLRHAGAAWVDDPSDAGSTEASQHPISRHLTMPWRLT
jgi:hypothetical protein